MPEYTDWGSDFEWTQSGKQEDKWGRSKAAAKGAAAGAGGGIFGAAIGAGIGALTYKQPTLSEAEAYAMNYDKLKSSGLQEFGAKSMGRGFQGIGDYADAVKAFQAGGPPGMSELQGTIGDAQRVAGKLEGYRPERLDRALGEERDYIANVNTNINPLALRQRKQADAASRLRAGNMNLSEYQRGTLNRQDRQGAEQAIAEQGVGMVEGGRGRIAGMSGQADQLVNQALQSAMQGQLGIGRLKEVMAQLPMQYQSLLLSHLGQIPGMYQQFGNQFNPNQNQYDAAKQGGRQGTDWAKLASDAYGAYSAYKSGGGSSSSGGGKQPNTPDNQGSYGRS